MKQKMIVWMLAIACCLAVTAQAAEKKEEKADKAETENPVVKIVTTMGEIQVELYADKAPITVENFLKYTQKGLYNDKIFHRVMKGFMIQGGGITTDMVNKKPMPPIKNESYNKLRNKRGTLAMARTNAPDSATSQFFINHVDNTALDFDGRYKPGYAVFGKVIQGMDVVDKIAAVKVTNSQYFDEQYQQKVPCQNVPVQQVVIKSVTIMKDDDDCDDDDHDDHDDDDEHEDCDHDHDDHDDHKGHDHD